MKTLFSRLPTQQLPLFAFLVVMLGLRQQRRVDVELAAAVLPRFEDEITALIVEREVRDIDCTVRHRLFVHWPPDTHSVVQNSHVLRLRRNIAMTLLTCAGTRTFI